MSGREACRHPLAADIGEHRPDVCGRRLVERDDAEWMLDYLDRFMDHYVVAPQKDSAVLAKWDKNIVEAGRKPIHPLPDTKDKS